MNHLIATDLDGTLLDHHTYTYAPAMPALTLCRKQDIPVIFNTSKTASESIRLRSELDNHHPFIVENGSAVYIPAGYFSTKPQDCVTVGDFWVHHLGKTREKILALLASINGKQHFRYAGFSEWSAEEIADKTGLPIESAREANQRDYSEPMLWQDEDTRFDVFRNLVNEQGMKILRGGRFLHVLGESDKGIALTWLKEQYQRATGKIFTLVALGDSDNDIDMLEAADIAIVVRSPTRDAPKLSAGNKVIYTRAYGPSGWNEALTQLLRTNDT
jgi:mannosyl-3-phosphoglycerate phosphatase family protein